MRLERNNIEDEFKVLAVFQTFIDWLPDYKSFRFHWDPVDGLGDCVLDKDPWENMIGARLLKEEK